jgi:hypothetical protein
MLSLFLAWFCKLYTVQTACAVGCRNKFGMTGVDYVFILNTDICKPETVKL